MKEWYFYALNGNSVFILFSFLLPSPPFSSSLPSFFNLLQVQLESGFFLWLVSDVNSLAMKHDGFRSWSLKSKFSYQQKDLKAILLLLCCFFFFFLPNTLENCIRKGNMMFSCWVFFPCVKDKKNPWACFILFRLFCFHLYLSIFLYFMKYCNAVIPIIAFWHLHTI